MTNDVQEVIEYRLARVYQVGMVLKGLIVYLMGMSLYFMVEVGVFGGLPGAVSLVAAIVSMIYGIVIVLDAIAREGRGWARSLLSLRFDYNDPPLSEWSDELERRDAFAITDEVAVADGGDREP